MFRNSWMRYATTVKRFPVAADQRHDTKVANLMQGLTTYTNVFDESEKMAAVDAAFRGLPNIMRFIRTYRGVPETTPCYEGVDLRDHLDANDANSDEQIQQQPERRDPDPQAEDEMNYLLLDEQVGFDFELWPRARAGLEAWQQLNPLQPQQPQQPPPQQPVG